MPNLDSQKQQNMNDKDVCVPELNDKAIEALARAFNDEAGWEPFDNLNKHEKHMIMSAAAEAAQKYEAAKGDGWCYDMDKVPFEKEVLVRLNTSAWSRPVEEYAVFVRFKHDDESGSFVFWMDTFGDQCVDDMDRHKCFKAWKLPQPPKSEA